MPEVQTIVTIAKASTEVRVISTDVKWKYSTVGALRLFTVKSS